MIRLEVQIIGLSADLPSPASGVREDFGGVARLERRFFTHDEILRKCMMDGGWRLRSRIGGRHAAPSSDSFPRGFSK